jgi:hypothetical protein
MSLSHTGKKARDAARARGEQFYISGKPCSRGHTGPRYVANQTCLECSKEQQRQADLKRRARRDSDAVFAKYRRAQRAASNRASNKLNRGRKAAEWAAWYADRLQRTPPWADLKAIKTIYDESHRVTKATGLEHHVDHIIPMRGKLVSGLHVAENLRVLPGPENLAKGSKFMS